MFGRGEDPTKHEDHGDFEAALKGLVERRDDGMDVHSPAPDAISSLWLHSLVPSLHKVRSGRSSASFSMPIYVRIGMQALYHGKRQEKILATKRVADLLKEQSIKQGKVFDSPEHALEQIQKFIKTYQIDCSELLRPNIADYPTFNSFFYRQLRPGARPIDSPGDPTIISSAADCRLTVYPTIDKAKEFWIKGAQFTLASLLQDEGLADSFHEAGAGIALFRLAPADYHRYHSPVSAVVGPTKHIEGDYYTVNPTAVNEDLNVFTENKRDVTLLYVPQAGLTPINVAFVAIGAMLVGSIKSTVAEGQSVHRGEELGYFAYGGSTVAVVFPAGKVQWDDDLVVNSQVPLETAVRVGERIGRFV